jgi:hypothetical protein
VFNLLREAGPMGWIVAVLAVIGIYVSTRKAADGGTRLWIVGPWAVVLFAVSGINFALAIYNVTKFVSKVTEPPRQVAFLIEGLREAVSPFIISGVSALLLVLIALGGRLSARGQPGHPPPAQL